MKPSESHPEANPNLYTPESKDLIAAQQGGHTRATIHERG